MYGKCVRNATICTMAKTSSITRFADLRFYLFGSRFTSCSSRRRRRRKQIKPKPNNLDPHLNTCAVLVV